MVASISPGVPAKVVPLWSGVDSDTTCASSDDELIAKSSSFPCYLNTTVAPEGARVRVPRQPPQQLKLAQALDRGGSDSGLSSPRRERAALHSGATSFVPSSREPEPVYMPSKRADGEEVDPDVLNQSIDRGSLTSLMLHNIPKTHTLDMLIDLLDHLGLRQECDFLYLPLKLETGTNFGYVFINMTSPEAAKRLNMKYHVYCEAELPCTMFRPVTTSKIQGLAANILRYQDSPLMDPDIPDKFKPALFQDGRRVPFPLCPTRGVRHNRLTNKLRKQGRA